MADSYEKDLAQKSSLTTSDYIRVVGSDNVSYKQLVSSVMSTMGFTDAWVASADLNNYKTTGVYWISSSPTNAPTGLTWFPVAVVGKTDTVRQIALDSSNTIYTRVFQSNAWGAWVKQPTRAEITPTSANLTAGTDITFATDFDNKATKTGNVVCVVFNLAPSTAINSGAVLATIPSGYRPSKQIRSTCYFSDGYARFAVNANGEIVALTNASSGKYFMGAITYII